MVRRALVLSDTHLQSSTDPFLSELIAWIESFDLRGGQDALVLLGDLCDLFVGTRHEHRAQHSAWLQFLEKLLIQGVKIFWIEGNHDFLLKRGVDPRINTVAESTQLEIGEGNLVWFEHGDLVNLQDRGYLFLRRVLRSKLFELFSRIAPRPWFDLLAATLKKRASRSPTLTLSAELREKYFNHARALFSRGYTTVVMGHCHDLHDLREGTNAYLNMGYPPRDRFGIWIDGQSVTRSPIPSSTQS